MGHGPSSIEIDRPLTPDELALVRWLLEHGDGHSAAFLEQLALARVVAHCGCGCASIDFSIDGKSSGQVAMRVLSDYQWRDAEGDLYGAFVFERGGLLAGLELWSIDGQSIPRTIPAIDDLVPYGSLPKA